MFQRLNKMIRTFGEAATALQGHRQQRLDWRTEATISDGPKAWAHITGETPKVQTDGLS